MTAFPYREDSIRLIQANQATSGAYIASPAFAHYRYSWLRDGSFIAYAMNLAKEHDSARRFYQWCKDVILAFESKVRMIIAKVESGKPGLSANQFLHARYTVDGEEIEAEWGNFQLDGYGTWLWGFHQYLQLTGEMELLPSFRQAIELTVEYLCACWKLPNYDCWEEFGESVHPSTLAAIYGGLTSIAPYLIEKKEKVEQVCQEIREFVQNHGKADGHFIKSIGSTEIDASLLWLSLPFGLVELEDPAMIATVRLIEERLLIQGYGVHRYPQDTYYGGGQWILLSAWLGWYYIRLGEREKAEEILTWIESKYSVEGLPEQVQDHLLAPEQYEPWVKRSGEPACPLLWSHAMYLVLVTEIGR